MTDTNSYGFSDDDDLEPLDLIFADDDLGRADEPEATQIEDARDEEYSDSYSEDSSSYKPEATR